MATTVVKTIGNGTRDYTSIQAWEDAAPANLVTADQVWEGRIYPEGAGTNGEWTISACINIAGSTSDATRFKRLRCAAGMSFSDNASAAANVLRYNPANGVAIRQTNSYGAQAIFIDDSYVELVGLQLSNFNGTSTLGLGANATVKNGIFQHSGNGGVIGCSYAGSKVVNSVLVHTGTQVCVTSSNAPVSLTGCTLFRPTGSSAMVSATYAGSVVLKDCAAFGFSGSTGVSSSSSYCATDLASLPGTSNQTSLSVASQFENITAATLDLRAKSGNSLQNGVSDALIATDVISQTRAATPTMGAWEYVSAGSPNASASGGTGTGTGSGSGGTATGGSGGAGSAGGGTGTSTGSGSGGTATGAGAGTFTAAAMENNSGAGLLASTAVVWSWYQGAIGAAPTSTTHGTGTTNSSGVLTASGLPTGAGFLLVRTTDSAGVYYQPGTVS